MSCQDQYARQKTTMQMFAHAVLLHSQHTGRQLVVWKTDLLPAFVELLSRGWWQVDSEASYLISQYPHRVPNLERWCHVCRRCATVSSIFMSPSLENHSTKTTLICGKSNSTILVWAWKLEHVWIPSNDCPFSSEGGAFECWDAVLNLEETYATGGRPW